MKIATVYRIALLAGVLFGNTAKAGWMMRPGDPADCKNAPMKAWPGHWLALKHEGNVWQVASTEVAIVNGEYRSSKLADYIIEAGWQEADGLVRSASISRRGDDFLFEFDGANYQWIQAAGTHYYLTDGKSYWNGAWREMHHANRPTAPISKERHRCGFYDGCHELLWAGDINRDGNLDLIVRFSEGEDEGLQLWVGKRDHNGLYFQTSDRGLYEYDMSFICATRNMGR